MVKGLYKRQGSFIKLAPEHLLLVSQLTLTLAPQQPQWEREACLE